MRIEFEIPDEKAQGLHDPGKNELTKHCKKWTEDILDEASRIEADRNETDNIEITAALINEAAFFSKRFPAKKKKKWWVKLIQVVSSISSLVTGSMLNFDKAKVDTSHFVWLLIFFFIAAGTMIYLTFNSEQNG